MIDIYKVLRCTPETVTDKDIEVLKIYEQKGSYPPHIKVQFSPYDSQSGNTQVTLFLHGLKNTFSRTISLGKENIGICVEVYYIITKKIIIMIKFI